MKRFLLTAALALAPLTAMADHGQYRRHYQPRYYPRPSVIAPQPIRYRVVYQGNDGQRLTVITLDTYTGQLSQREFRVNALDNVPTATNPRRRPARNYNPGRTGAQINRDIQRGR